MDSKLLKDFTSYSREKYTSFNLENNCLKNAVTISHLDVNLDEMKSNTLYNINNDEYNNEVTLYSYDAVFVDCYGREISKDWNALEGVNKSQESINNLTGFNKCTKKRSTLVSNKKPTGFVMLENKKINFARPKFSYTQLITMAIESSTTKALSLNDIYTWCEQNYMYYANTQNVWKNSLRHNLSINKCFKKIQKPAFGGRGSLWMLDPRVKRNLDPNPITLPIPSTILPTKRSKVNNRSTKKPLKTPNAMIICEKPRENWTDTRLYSSVERKGISDCQSVTSDSDYNDWQRSVEFLEPVYPVKTHWYSDCIVTPCPFPEHTYCLPELHKLRNNHTLSSRHTFLSSIGYPNPFRQPISIGDDNFKPLQTNNFQLRYSNMRLPYITTGGVEPAKSSIEEIGSPCSDDAITKFREDDT